MPVWSIDDQATIVTTYERRPITEFIDIIIVTSSTSRRLTKSPGTLCLFRLSSKKISKLRNPYWSSLGNPPETGGFSSQMASDARNGSMTSSCHLGAQPITKNAFDLAPVLLQRSDAVARIPANGSAAFNESCTPIG